MWRLPLSSSPPSTQNKLRRALVCGPGETRRAYEVAYWGSDTVFFVSARTGYGAVLAAASGFRKRKNIAAAAACAATPNTTSATTAWS